MLPVFVNPGAIFLVRRSSACWVSLPLSFGFGGDSYWFVMVLSSVWLWVFLFHCIVSVSLLYVCFTVLSNFECIVCFTVLCLFYRIMYASLYCLILSALCVSLYCVYVRHVTVRGCCPGVPVGKSVSREIRILHVLWLHSACSGEVIHMPTLTQSFRLSQCKENFIMPRHWPRKISGKDIHCSSVILEPLGWPNSTGYDCSDEHCSLSRCVQTCQP